MTVATKAMEEIEKNPALKLRVMAAFKDGDTRVLKKLVDHPAINILLTAIDKGFIHYEATAVPEVIASG